MAYRTKVESYSSEDLLYKMHEAHCVYLVKVKFQPMQSFCSVVPILGSIYFATLILIPTSKVLASQIYRNVG